MGGLYLGFFTATESAAVGVILVLIFIFARGQLTLNLLKEAFDKFYHKHMHRTLRFLPGEYYYHQIMAKKYFPN